MTKLTIIEGNFARIPAANCTDRWVVDNGDLSGAVYQRVTGAALVMDDGRIAPDGVFASREAAERAIDPKHQAALDEAKRRSGAYWS